MKKNEKKIIDVERVVNNYIRQRKKDRDYWSILRGITGFLKKSNMFEAIASLTEEDAVRYKVFLKSERSSSTANKHISVLKGLYRTLKDAGIVKASPFAGVRTPAQGTNRVRYNRNVEAGEIEKFFRVISKDEALVSVRDIGMLRILFGHALRISEVLALDLRDFDGNAIKICNRKAGKSITRHLSEGEKKEVLAWLKVRGIGAGYLFCSVQGRNINTTKMLSPKTVNDRIGLYCNIAGIPRFTSHSGRVSAITRALEMGYTYEDVAGLTGHSSIKQVEGYDRRHRKTISISYEEKLHG